MSSRPVAIRADDLSKRYDVYARPVDRLRKMVLGRLRRFGGFAPGQYAREFWALHPISFDVAEGETLGIIGRNGSGKSTLLQLICGTLTPTTGSVSRHGRVAALLELGAGFNPEFTGEENIRLSGLLYGIVEQELARRFDSIVAFSDLGDFIKQPVKTYSSGMYVRLAFAVAAHVDADVLVIDEALSVGDVRFSQKCARYLRDFQSRGTLLFVSHDLSAVINLCSRAIWLEQGRMMMDGPSKQVVESYLAEQHAQDRAAAGARVTSSATNSRGGRARTSLATEVDVRSQAIVGFPGRTAMPVFEFDPERVPAAFGERKIEIDDVRLRADTGDPSAHVLEGEVVVLEISARAFADVQDVIFGFYVKDRLGQRLFGDNSYLMYLSSPPRASAGERMVARFRFRMPLMPSGEYTVDVAVASGSQNDHTQQHWIHDALSFRSNDATLRHGLIGIPMLEISVGLADG
jgi:lipopolysaccharide transport system ATP-binding protein